MRSSLGRERAALSVTDDSRGPGGDGLAYTLCRKPDITNQAISKTMQRLKTSEFPKTADECTPRTHARIGCLLSNDER